MTTAKISSLLGLSLAASTTSAGSGAGSGSDCMLSGSVSTTPASDSEDLGIVQNVGVLERRGEGVSLKEKGLEREKKGVLEGEKRREFWWWG